MSKEWSKEVFAKNLQRYMDAAGKNQKEMAEIVGVSATTFHEWLRSKKYPRIDKVEKLANYFGILKSDLIEEKMTDEKEKDNDILSDIIVRMRSDKDFKKAVEALYTLDSVKINAVIEMLNAFVK